ncbi:MAG: muramoyltetrapeptide carboxypeptidase [Rhodanobacter sp.]
MASTRIQLIAPSGYPHHPAAMERGFRRLHDAGCVLGGLDVLKRREQRYAGTDAERASDLNALASVPDLPDIVLAVRGGYGATRVLERLDHARLRERLAGSSTMLVGHSDFTAVQLALLARAGLCTFSGPMLGADFGAEVLSEFTWNHFWNIVRSPTVQLQWLASSAAELDVEGPLWGGNLAVLCSLIGTPYCPNVDGGILYVEDVAEPAFRIERMLYQLHLSGILGRQRALLLGGFSQCRSSPYDQGYGLADGFRQIRALTRTPLVEGLPIGHVPDKLTLPCGGHARLRVSGGKAELELGGYPHMQTVGKAAPETLPAKPGHD